MVCVGAPFCGEHYFLLIILCYSNLMVPWEPIYEGLGFIPHKIIQDLIIERHGDWVMDISIPEVIVLYIDPYFHNGLFVLDDYWRNPFCFIYWKDDSCIHHFIYLLLEILFYSWVQPIQSMVQPI